MPLQPCRNYNTPDDLKALTHPKSNKRYLVSCMLDTCVFSSGMISRMYVPELTYGKQSSLVLLIFELSSFEYLLPTFLRNFVGEFEEIKRNYLCFTCELYIRKS